MVLEIYHVVLLQCFQSTTPELRLYSPELWQILSRFVSKLDKCYQNHSNKCPSFGARTANLFSESFVMQICVPCLVLHKLLLDFVVLFHLWVKMDFSLHSQKNQAHYRMLQSSTLNIIDLFGSRAPRTAGKLMVIVVKEPKFRHLYCSAQQRSF